MRQGEYQSLQDFYKWFKNHVTMMNEVGAIFADDSLVGQVAMMNGQAYADNEDRKMARSPQAYLHEFKGPVSEQARHISHQLDQCLQCHVMPYWRLCSTYSLWQWAHVHNYWWQ